MTSVRWRNVTIEPDPFNRRDMTRVTTISCPVCDAISTFTLATASVRAWMDGELIQDAFPELDPIQRESLITGICSDKCFNEIFEETSEN